MAYISEGGNKISERKVVRRLLITEARAVTQSNRHGIAKSQREGRGDMGRVLTPLLRTGRKEKMKRGGSAKTKDVSLVLDKRKKEQRGGRRANRRNPGRPQSREKEGRAGEPRRDRCERPGENKSSWPEKGRRSRRINQRKAS